MIYWSVGTVIEELDARPGIQELRVQMPDGETAPALHYTDSSRPAAEGDRVVLNTTALDLKLGTGGYHFVVSFAVHGEEDELGAAVLGPTATRHAGHMMKLRYTPLQHAVLAAEEADSPHHEVFLDSKRLEGMPVIIGELHSMLPIAAAWLRYRHTAPLKIVYIMSDGGALPLAFSKHAAYLRQAGFIDGTITYGNAYGGEIETLNKYTALIAAKHIMKADVTIITMGPGIAGTGTALGHMGVETGEIANAAAKLGGVPILIPRISFADGRNRHYGLSHHSLSVLRDVAACPLEIVLPEFLQVQERALILSQLQTIPSYPVRWVQCVDKATMLEALGRLHIPVCTMGRDFKQDPAFFLGVGAAAEHSLEHVMSPG